ncbi:OmpH family outer membrane protein [Gramella sp. MAR_2010_147]|uniref:OmpH family outer membrane protein n=1 Tax=Gramella sp. MAR_2010_147 TaxID=1250205 RepID=UPI00087BC47F|nr:OmpH family outer membrane protein [Gramella sp. MAR_2010_147]SDS68318.1 periplasmic chaperone for outer membrane proteins Skp [Gramella sp. MAR_2010_147]
MKRVILGMLLLFIAFSANAQSKIGTINAEYILSQMPENTEVNKNIEAYNTELQGELKQNIEEYETLVKDYQNTSEGLEEEERKEKESKIIELENDIKGFRQKASVMMQVRRNELTGPLYGKIDVAMQQVIEEENFTQIFLSSASGLAFSRPEDDITLKVMDKLGIEPKEPKPATENTVEN